MSVLEAIGFFWTILATGLFTATVLVAATWSITLGLKVAIHRYRIGESMERTVNESADRRQGVRLS